MEFPDFSPERLAELDAIYRHKEAQDALREATTALNRWRLSPIHRGDAAILRETGRFYDTEIIEDWNFTGQAAALYWIRENPHHSVYLHGLTGAGKTTLLAYKLRLALARRPHFKLGDTVFRYFPNDVALLDEIRRGYREGEYRVYNPEGIRNDYYRLGLKHHLFLGDFGYYKETEKAVETFRALFDALDQCDGEISMASQMDPDSLLGVVGDSTFRRIHDMCKVFEVSRK